MTAVEALLARWYAAGDAHAEQLADALTADEINAACDAEEATRRAYYPMAAEAEPSCITPPLVIDCAPHGPASGGGL
jgi:hypothetical protein